MVLSDDPTAAAIEAKRAVEEATAEAERRLEDYYKALREAFDEVGAAELARRLGVSRQRIYQVLEQAERRRRRGD